MCFFGEMMFKRYGKFKYHQKRRRLSSRGYIYIGSGKYMLRINKGIKRPKKVLNPFDKIGNVGYKNSPWFSDMLDRLFGIDPRA